MTATEPSVPPIAYREVAPPERLVNTESWGPDWPETLNTLILTKEDGKTTATQWMRTIA
jgi:uncharacterized protein YndB with AHSA1/START domain